MLLKHVLQELNKYLREFDTNIVGIKKVGSEIIFKIKEKENVNRQREKKDSKDYKQEVN